MIRSYHDTIQAQAAELADWNRTLAAAPSSRARRPARGRAPLLDAEQGADPGQELLLVERLREEVVGAGLDRPHANLRVVRGQHHDRQERRSLVLAQPPAHLEPCGVPKSGHRGICRPVLSAASRRDCAGSERAMLGEAPLEGARARPIGADSGSDRRSQLGLARVETRATAPKRFTLNQTFRESRAQLWRAGVVNEAAGEVGHTIPRSQWGDRTTLFCPPHGVARAYRVPIRGSAISLQIRYARIWAPHRR